MNESHKPARTLIGKVSSNKMDKTITVLVERRVKHPVYGKYIKRRSKIHAHDPANQCQIGQTVEIQECRPIARHKAWRLVSILDENRSVARGAQ